MYRIASRQFSQRQQVRRSRNLHRRAAARPLACFVKTLSQSLDGNDFTFKGGSTMLHYTVVFFVVALIAAVLGFGGIAGTAAGIAKILFVIFLVLSVISLLLGRRAST
jgi:uncharacterized membrane protein YtjA (UPF0391 family)